MDSEENVHPPYYCWKGEQLYIDLLVQSDASHDQIVGMHGDRLKVRLASPPVAGKANDHLIRLMAEYYGVPNNRVHITKGHRSRMKQICVTDPQNNVPPPLII